MANTQQCCELWGVDVILVVLLHPPEVRDKRSPSGLQPNSAAVGQLFHDPFGPARLGHFRERCAPTAQSVSISATLTATYALEGRRGRHFWRLSLANYQLRIVPIRCLGIGARRLMEM